MLQEQVKARVQPTSALKGTILVHVPTEGEPHSLSLALGLAEAANGAVTAVVAEGLEVAPFTGEFGAGTLMQALLDAQRRRMAMAVTRAEAVKKTSEVPAEIYSEPRFPEEVLAAYACGADWIVMTRPDREGSHGVHADPSAVVLRAGLPVLLAPRAARPLTAGRIVVGWRDSREARRAIADAMPLLQAADEVLVVSVTSESRLDLEQAILTRLTARLGRLGCKAQWEMHQNDGLRGVGAVLEERAASIDADVIVTGAYAHSRAGEWVFGGVTRGLIERCDRYLLMSH